MTTSAPDEENGGASADSSPANPSRNRRKLDVCNQVLQRLKDSDEARLPGFEADLERHFDRLPPKYAMDVNVERAEQVLVHKNVLEQAAKQGDTPVFHVDAVQGSTVIRVDSQNSPSVFDYKESDFPPPIFSSGKANDLEESISNGNLLFQRPRYEITFATKNRPKLLNQLSSLLGEIDLNIEEAHAFLTNDGYALIVFLVKGEPYEEINRLMSVLKDKLEIKGAAVQDQSSPNPNTLPSTSKKSSSIEKLASHVKIPSDGVEWEIDFEQICLGEKVASGSYGYLHKGTYCNQDVAIKLLNQDLINEDMLREFTQEIYIMRKIRHKNIVQFLGACTRPPNLCIVTEFMSGGSVFDLLHKQKESFGLRTIVRVATDISKGMNYLHQNNIIHRDLKTANLLMDENKVIKISDFGISRVKSQSGVMTAETGTYRWMAPEVIEHKPYDHKADVFSFAIVLWELLAREIPYLEYTPLQAAVGVVQKGLRPTIPKNTPPDIERLLEQCWEQEPDRRPDFSDILISLKKIAKTVKDEPHEQHKQKSSSGFLSHIRLGHRSLR